MKKPYSCQYMTLKFDLFKGELRPTVTTVPQPIARRDFQTYWSEFVYAVVNGYDQKTLKKKVRSTWYQAKLTNESKNHHIILEKWRADNGIQREHESNFDHSKTHCCQLVFLPVTKTNASNTLDYNMRKTEFGMSSLDTKQELAIINYHTEMHVMFEV